MSEVLDIRKLLGLTQRQMADKLGMSLSGYQETETKPRKIHILAARQVYADHLASSYTDGR